MSRDDEESLRRQIVEEAMTWLRTPYIHLAAVKGVGVDCAMILIEIYKKFGFVPEDFDPRPYAPQWYLHRDEALYMAGMERFSRRIEADAVKPGDVAMFNFGRHAAHGAIVIDDNLLLHANRVNGNVELHERRSLEDRLDSYWSVFK
jgi:cell wall-associated NlpC family hydrolase